MERFTSKKIRTTNSSIGKANPKLCDSNSNLV